MQAWLDVIKAWDGKRCIGLCMYIDQNLWINRSHCLHNGKCLIPSLVFSISSKMNDDYEAANTSAGPRVVAPIVKWSSPTVGKLKMNSDAGFDRVEATASCGVVIRDHEGCAMLLAAQRYNKVEDVVKIELLVILLGLKLVTKRVLKVDIEESDSLLAVREINKVHGSFSEWFGIIKDILYYANVCILFQHVNREVNSLAHRVAHCCNID